MKKQIFSGKLYLQSLKKVRTLGIAVMIAVVLLNMFLPIMGIIESIEMDRRYERDLEYYETHKDEFPSNMDPDYYYTPQASEIEDSEFAPFLWAVAGFAPLLVIAMFSFLNERKQSDFYHSLPQTRVCVYLSMTAAIFTWLAGVILVSASLNALLFCFAKYYTVTVSTVFANIVFYLVLGLFMSGSMAVAMMITGTTVSNLLIYAFLMLFPRYLVVLLIGALESTLYILPNVSDYFSLLSLERFLPLSWAQGDIFRDGYLADGGMIVYSAIVGILMFAVAGVLYHFRRSESASKSAPNALAQHIYRSAFVTAMALTIPVFLAMDGFDELLILLVLLTFVVHILYELLTTKKIKKMVKSLPLIVIPFGIAAIFFGTIVGSYFYVYSVRPDADDVKSVSFTDMDSMSYGEYKMKGKQISDPKVIEMALRGLYNELDDVEYPAYSEYNHMTISYKLKSGRTIHRYVWLSAEDWKTVCSADSVKEYVLSLPAFEELRRIYIEPLPGVYYSSEIDDIEVYPTDEGHDSWDTSVSESYRANDLAVVKRHIWTLFASEYELLSDEKKLELLNYTNVHKTFNSYFIEISVSDSSDTTRYARQVYFTYPLLPEYTPKTVDYIMSLYGKEERILSDLQQMKAEQNFGGTATIYLKEKGEYQRFYVDPERIFKYTEIDSHLFDENGHDTLIVLYNGSGYSLWLNLTDEELQNILSEFGELDLELAEKYH